MDINQKLGEKLKRARKSCDLTQAKVAKYLGVKREVISYYENGARPVSLAELTKLSDLYGYNIGYFIGNDIGNDEIPDGLASLSFRATNIKDEDLEIIARVKRFAVNLHFLDSLLDERGIEL